MSMIFNKASKIQVLSFILFPLISQTIFCQLLNNLPFMYIFDLFLLKALVQLDNDIVVNVKICNYFMLYLKVFFSIGGSVKRKCFLFLSFLISLSLSLYLSLSLTKKCGKFHQFAKKQAGKKYDYLCTKNSGKLNWHNKYLQIYDKLNKYCRKKIIFW